MCLEAAMSDGKTCRVMMIRPIPRAVLDLVGEAVIKVVDGVRYQVLPEEGEVYVTVQDDQSFVRVIRRIIPADDADGFEVWCDVPAHAFLLDRMKK
jgi:hypothetical protein